MKKHLLIASVFLLGALVSQAQTWEKINTGTTLNLRSSCFTDSTHGWVAGGTAGATKTNILKTTDGGLSFVTQTTGYYNDISGIAAVDMNNAWVADGTIMIKQTTDGGTTWKTQTPGPSPTFPYNLLHDVFFKDTNHGWTVGDNGTIYHTTDGGASWTKQTSGTTKIISTVFFATTLVGWAAGDNTTFLRTNDGGASWSLSSTPPNVFGVTSYGINDIFFRDANLGWIATVGAVLWTGDGGTTWVPVATGGVNNSVFFATDDDGWAVGNYGSILHSVNGGKTWEIYTDVGDAFLYSVNFPDADHGWVTGGGGALYQYTNTKTTSVSNSATGPVFSLYQNYPNPFNPSTTIRYELHHSSFVKLTVYNTFGQQVSQLVNEQQQAGDHEVVFQVNRLGFGTYFYRLQAGDNVETKKMILLP